MNPGTIEVTANDELITSCNVCGKSAYRVIPRDRSIADSTDAYVSTGLKLFNLTYSPNGFQTYTTKLCVSCSDNMRRVLYDATKFEVAA